MSYFSLGTGEHPSGELHFFQLLTIQTVKSPFSCQEPQRLVKLRVQWHLCLCSACKIIAGGTRLFCLIAVYSHIENSIGLIVISQTRQLEEITRWMSVTSFPSFFLF